MKNLSRSKSVFNSSDVPNAPRSLRRSGLAMLSVVSLGLASCASGPNAQTGTVLGGLGGAAAGGIIGHQSGRGLEGAAIGGALGAVGGNAVGNAQDQRNYHQRY